MDLKNELEHFEPFNRQELVDKKTMLKLLDTGYDLYDRNNVAHFTASSWVVNHSHDRVLMAYHPIYNTWAWLGGHADGDHDLLHVARKEINEESNLYNMSFPYDGIFSIEILPVNAHIRKGLYVPNHLHLNVTYLFEADSAQTEFLNQDARWIPLDQLDRFSNEKDFIERVYNKLIDKLKKLDQQP